MAWLCETRTASIDLSKAFCVSILNLSVQKCELLSFSKFLLNVFFQICIHYYSYYDYRFC